MDPEILFKVWDRFDRSDVTELVYETSLGSITLRKDGLKRRSEYTAAEEIKEVQPLSDKKEDKSGDEGTFVLRAPLVGTFYRAPSETEQPFVMIGQRVKAGDVVGIIEAMKLMNEITAPCDGVIKSIFVENETFVEFDQKILEIGEG